ncbi:unnamed protein product [Bemisia tabaci]|uniref:Uncharacterized protein n=1 Tax=Bemisia tabaci TaxID=7038 RepID=A0A9P0ANW6_BEMTA|nr:unnamed protein product [Bemisia tabaci]
MAFFIAAVLACLQLAAGNPFPHYHGHAGAGGLLPRGGMSCPRAPLPEITPTVLQSVFPSPVTFGSQSPAVLEHVAAPQELNYFEKPYILKHRKGAALNVFTQTPVVVDEYAVPVFNEFPGAPAVVVEEVAAPAYDSASSASAASAASAYAAASASAAAAASAGASEYGVWGEYPAGPGSCSASGSCSCGRCR